MTDLLKELIGTACQCGSEKVKHQTFCRKCYFALPRHIQNRLYQKVGNGYEEAYQEAVDFLSLKKAMGA